MALRLPIYLDHHATTPVDPRVLEAMEPYFTDKFGNAASSSHRFGWIAEEAVEGARGKVAALIGASPSEIVFTSGATEANNLAILGVREALALDPLERQAIQAGVPLPPRWAGLEREELLRRGDHFITVATEHKAVLDPMAALAAQGLRVTVLPVDAQGLVDPAAIERAIEPGTVLISVMLANNEIGVIQPLAEIAAIAKRHRVLLHTDAVQAAGKIPLDVKALDVDLLSLSAHKFYGPKGVGALWVRRKSPRPAIAPRMLGGGHERGLRSGTLDVPGIVGFGRAAEIAAAELSQESPRLRALRDRLYQGILARVPEVELNGHPELRLPGNLQLSFRHVSGEALMNAMRDLAVSSGSACTSALRAPSHVIRALGGPDDRAHSSIRIGIGRFNTEAEIDHAIQVIADKVQQLREISPVWERAQKDAPKWQT
ncbi:MAG: aminotransferase class V-fold PLP-dependent enzyme [Myxococcota bacterium]